MGEVSEFGVAIVPFASVHMLVVAKKGFNTSKLSVPFNACTVLRVMSGDPVNHTGSMPVWLLSNHKSKWSGAMLGSVVPPASGVRCASTRAEGA